MQRPRGFALHWAATAGFVLTLLCLAQYSRLGGHGASFDTSSSIHRWFQGTKYHSWEKYQNWTLPHETVAGFVPRDLKAEFHRTRIAGCASWTTQKALAVEDDRFDNCWRHKPYVQLHHLLQTEGVRREHLTRDSDIHTIQSLYACYADVEGRLECPDNKFRVLFGSYVFFKASFDEPAFPSGEMIWQRSQVLALQELGFTLFSARSYESLITVARQIPDVVSILWMADESHMSCEHDPRCVKDMKSTYDTYPDFRSIGGRPLWANSLATESVSTVQPHRWLYSQERLDGVPKHERGVIPRWKLFTATVWGAVPGQGIQRIPQYPLSDFSYGQLGSQWSVSPFQWPNHTYLPFSIEHACMKTPFFPPSERKNRFFVLAKHISYFYLGRAPKPEVWSKVYEETGVQVASAAGNDKPEDELKLPHGVTTTGRLSPDRYTEEVGRSQAMIAIGAPEISPSPYFALCQGTPVLMPYFRDVRPNDTWTLMSAGAYSQHGPLLLQAGPPYVYPYRAGNETDLIAKLKAAAANPIDRYFIPEQMWEAVKERLHWYMWFDWERLSQAVTDANNDQYSISHLMTAGRCFDKGGCDFLRAT